MRNFIVRDLNIFDDWDFSTNVGSDGKTYEESDLNWVEDFENYRPITIFQDGTVYGRNQDRSVDIAIDAAPYSDEEFRALWKEYGYPDIPIEE